jgi:hypothetical protein
VGIVVAILVVGSKLFATSDPIRQCHGRKGSDEAQNGRVYATKTKFNYSVKAMACWLGFGFWNPKPGQCQLQAMTFGLAWLGLYGLAWLGFWPEAKPCTSLVPIQFKKISQ